MSEEIKTEPATPADGSITVTTPQHYTVTVQAPTTTTQQPQVKKPPVKKTPDSNDPERFKGEGVVFNAKLIGEDDVEEARGDKMCQEKITRLKAIVKASGEHKLKIIVNVSEAGIKLIDLRTGSIIHHHPVHRISFISRDVTDRRAFGYIFGAEDKTHKFFGIKTEKAAEALVLTLRDLFQVIYENKKKEMEAAKNQQDAEEKKQEEENKNVVKLGGDLATESSTDDEPVYSVPQNNNPVKKSEENILELQSELVSIEKGIEQMNTMESLFETSPPTSATPASQVDPWGAPATSQPSSADAPTTGSTSDDLKDIDLFGTDLAQPKKKEDIMSLFGPTPGHQSGFGGPQSGAFGAQPGFGAPPVQSGFGAPPVQSGFGTPAQPAFGASFPAAFPQPTANPFGAAPTQGGLTAPPIPQRNTPSPQPNPFGGGGFPPQQGGFGGANMFGGQPNANPNASLFDEPVLAPTVVKDPFAAPPTTTESKGDAFSDLVNLGSSTSKANKSPKDLFADLNSVPKKSINELRSAPGDPGQGPVALQASDPFGAVDNTTLPDALNFSQTLPHSSDPFDTSFLHTNQASPIVFHNSAKDVQNTSCIEKDNKLGFSDDDFDLPSPEGPPPPLPTFSPPELPKLSSSDSQIIPPAPPPRPGSANSATSTGSTPPVPPRNSNAIQNHSTYAVSAKPPYKDFKPIPRPRPTNTLKTETSLPDVPANHTVALHTADPYHALSHCSTAENVNKSVKHTESDVMNGKGHTHSFVIEDPFADTDPFADSDPFESSKDFSSGFDTLKNNDPFTSLSSQSDNKQQNGEKDDPFAVFDNSFCDTFNFKSSSLKKKSKRKSSGSKHSPAADPSDPFGALLTAKPAQNGPEPLYASVNKQPFS